MHASGSMPSLNHAADGGDEVGGDSAEDADMRVMVMVMAMIEMGIVCIEQDRSKD